MTDTFIDDAATGTSRFRLRPFSPSDLPELAATATEWALADGLPFAVTPDAIVMDVLRFPGLDPQRDVVVAEAAGRIVGASWLRSAIRDGEWRHGHEGGVLPEWRGRGIGRALFRWSRERATARRTELAADGLDHRLTGTASDSNAAEMRLFESEGYRAVRWFALMTRGLTGDAALEPERPVDGIVVRALEPDELRGSVFALSEAFEDHYGHRDLTEGDVERTARAESFDPTLWRVAWAGDEIAGVSRNAFDEEETARLGLRQGWIEQIGVRRGWRGRGVATLLMASSMAEFARRGFDRAILGVDLDNPTGALGLYRRLGFAELSRATEWMRDLPVRPARPDDLRASDPDDGCGAER